MELLTKDNSMRSGELYIQAASLEGSSVTDHITLHAVLTIRNIVQEIRESGYGHCSQLSWGYQFFSWGYQLSWGYQV